MTQVNIHEAKTHFSKLIQKALAGEVVIIAKGNKPVAKLVSLTKSSSKRKLGAAKGKITVAPDFEQIPAEFEEYVN